MPKPWNLYNPARDHPAIGDTVRYRGADHLVEGSMGADSEGTPYVRLRPVGGGEEVVCLVTALEHG